VSDEDVAARVWSYHLSSRRWGHASREKSHEHGRHVAECVAFRRPEAFQTPWVRAELPAWSEAKRLLEWGGPYYPDDLSEIQREWAG